MQGLGVAMFESVMYTIIGDLFFVHERGSRTALLTTSISGLANLPTMLAGVITQNLGWRWMFWLLTIFMAIAVVGLFLFGWETAYIREHKVAAIPTEVSPPSQEEPQPEFSSGSLTHASSPMPHSVVRKTMSTCQRT